RCLVTIWRGSSRPPLMLQFAMETEQWNSPTKPCVFRTARIPLIYERWPLLAPRPACSLKHRRLPRERYEKPSSVATLVWATRFAMKSHCTNSACRFIDSFDWDCIEAIICKVGFEIQ